MSSDYEVLSEEATKMHRELKAIGGNYRALSKSFLELHYACMDMVAAFERREFGWEDSGLRVSIEKIRDLIHPED